MYGVCVDSAARFCLRGDTIVRYRVGEMITLMLWLILSWFEISRLEIDRSE